MVGKPNQIARSCPVCGANQAQPRLEKGELQLVQCSACAMIYANPVATDFASGRFYNGTAADYYLCPPKLESDYAPVRFGRELRLFRRHCRGGAVLDVGCSSGAFLYQLAHRFPGNYEGLGMDASGPALDYAETRSVRVLRGDFLAHDFGEKRFNAITFWAVLEHVLEPHAFLAKAWSILQPGGLCFVLVPNMGSLAYRLLGAKYRYIYPQHLNYFTRRTMGLLVERKFTVVAVRCTHFNPVVLWQDARHGGREVSNEERGRLLKQTTAYKQNPWLKPIKALYSLTEKGLGAVNLADNLVMVLQSKSADILKL